MARKRTGLSNKYRNGKGTYCKKRKREGADHYGKFRDGVRLNADRIAGRIVY